MNITKTTKRWCNDHRHPRDTRHTQTLYWDLPCDHARCDNLAVVSMVMERTGKVWEG